MANLLDFCSITGKPVKEFEGEKKYIATGDIIDNKIISYTPITFDNRPSRANQMVELGDVGFAAMKDTEKVFVINDQNVNNVYSTGFYFLKTNSNINNRFLYYFIKSRAFNYQKNKLCTGATMKAINNKNLQKITISSIPSIDVQNDIVKRFDSIEKVIDNYKNQICDIEKAIKSKYNEMFGTYFSTKYKLDKMNKYITIKHGYAFSGENFIDTDNGHMLVTPGNFKLGGGFQEKKCRYYNGNYPSEYILKPNDLVVTMTDLSKNMDTLGLGAIIPNNPKKKYLHNQRIGLVNFDNTIFNNYFILYYLSTDYYRSVIKSTAQGATVHHTSPTKMLNVDIIIPPLELQNKFKEIAVNSEKIISNCEDNIKDLEKLLDIEMEKIFEDKNE